MIRGIGEGTGPLGRRSVGQPHLDLEREAAAMVARE
jgi:hypothetical protein